MKRALLILITACASTGDPGDGADDAFLSSGESDSGISEGSPEATGVLRVANELTRAQLDGEVGLAAPAASAIDKARRGPDGVANTADDHAFATLAELDAVKYVGPTAFAHLLDYARDRGYIAESSWPVNPWVVDPSCAPITFAQLVSKFGPGETQAVIGHAIARGRTRAACNAVTGCTPWQDPTRAWLYPLDPVFGAPDVDVGMPDLVEITAAVVGDQIVVGIAADGVVTPSMRITAAVAAYPTDVVPVDRFRGVWTTLSSQQIDLAFPTRFHRSAFAPWDKRICSDGRVHFVTRAGTGTDGDSLEQIAFYGRLF